MRLIARPCRICTCPHKSNSTLCRSCQKLWTAMLHRAASKVAYAIKTGSIADPTRFMCDDCGIRYADYYYHHDYNYPLEVDPLCSACHPKRAKGIPDERFWRDIATNFGCSIDTAKNLADILAPEPI